MNRNENKTMLDANNQRPKYSTELNVTAEEQLASSIADLLDARAQHLGVDIERRLSQSRNLAVTKLAERQAEALSHQGVNQSGDVLQWFDGNVGHYFANHRILSFTIVAIIALLSFFAIQQLGMNNNLEHSDAFLLASDLPPEAYADKGFDTWLETAD